MLPTDSSLHYSFNVKSVNFFNSVLNKVLLLLLLLLMPPPDSTAVYCRHDENSIQFQFPSDGNIKLELSRIFKMDYK